MARRIHRSATTLHRAQPVGLAMASIVWGALGCASLPGPLSTHESPPTLQLAGEGKMAEEGALIFSVADELVCERVIIKFKCKETKASLCGETERIEEKERVDDCDASVETLIATPPWEAEAITAEVDATGAARFAIDWEITDLDPESADIRTVLGREWQISSPSNIRPFKWRPNDGDVDIMVRALGKEEIAAPVAEKEATGPAEVEVVSASAEGGALVAGDENLLSLALRNKGPGTAHEVKVKTRSSNPQLHNLQFSFGRIRPGAEVSRSVDVTVEPLRKKSRALVLFFVDWRGAKQTVEHRAHITIEPTREKPKLPELSVSCRLEGQVASQSPTVYPGQAASIWCIVENTGDATARAVTVSAKAAGKTFKKNIKRRIRRGKRAGARVELRVPSDPKLIGTRLIIETSATAKNASKPATFELAVQITKPSRCPGGLLSRKEYQSKRAKLEKALQAGALSQDEFDEYDAELVGCLE